MQKHAVQHFEYRSSVQKLPMFVRRFQDALLWYKATYATLQRCGVTVD